MLGIASLVERRSPRKVSLPHSQGVHNRRGSWAKIDRSGAGRQEGWVMQGGQDGEEAKRGLGGDDEPKIVEVVGDSLRSAGFSVITAADGQGAVALARARPPDLVVLDLGLPGLDGLDVARDLRRASPVPIIMLTARGAETDRVV